MVAVTKLFQFLDVDQSGSLDADGPIISYEMICRHGKLILE